MTTAEIITIGTEILLGEIQDTNTAFLARQFRQLGIDLYRVTTVGDNTLLIADTIRECLSRAEVVITTGGLGPTIDDPTRNAAAIAVNTEVVFHPELWKKINDRFQRRGITPSENNRKQAFLPVTAIAIDNPVGTAPAFYILNHNRLVICLPGVPAEMETIFTRSVIPLLQHHFTLEKTIKTRILHTSGIGESVVDDLIADLETGENPTVGLSAHPAIVDIRITAKASSIRETDRMISLIENEIRQRMPDAIFGEDENTLPQMISSLIQANQQMINICLSGWNVDFTLQFDQSARKWIKCTRLNQPFIFSENDPINQHQLLFAFNLRQDQEITTMELIFVQDDRHDIQVRTFNGAQALLSEWVTNMCMDFIWREIRNF